MSQHQDAAALFDLQHRDAAARVELESTRLALEALARQVAACAELLAPGPQGEWRGSAKNAFSAALGQLHRDVDAAADLVRAAEQFTAAALQEVGGRG